MTEIGKYAYSDVNSEVVMQIILSIILVKLILCGCAIHGTEYEKKVALDSTVEAVAFMVKFTPEVPY